MKTRPGVKDALRMLPTAAILVLLLVLVLRLHSDQKPAEQVAFKARRVDLVGRMRLALASASEAEKSAVLATTDQDSTTFADQARAATADVARAQGELSELLEKGGTQAERDQLAQFSQAFTELRRVDDDVLALAVKNTNLKAYDLAFGPAAVELKQMDSALERLVEANGDSPQARGILLRAYDVRIGGLRIQTLLPPHIAEESDQKMTELEAAMAKEDEQVRKNLDELGALEGLNDRADLVTATQSYARFNEIKGKILGLSRENTNVRSLAISLNQKRKGMLLCQEYLNTLQMDILAEPIAGVMYGPPAKPR